MRILPAAVVTASFIVSVLGAGQVFAQAGHAGHHRGHSPVAASADAVAAGWSEGTIRRVNADTEAVTIAHGPLVNLDMPPMTMTFRVSGEATLDGLAIGDKVRFAAAQDGGEFVVTAIEKLER